MKSQVSNMEGKRAQVLTLEDVKEVKSMLYQITNYWIGYRHPLHRFEIKLYAEEKEVGRLYFTNPSEYQGVIDMLRNEMPVYFETKYTWLYTGWEPEEREPVGPGDENWTKGPEEIGPPSLEPGPKPGE